MTYGWAILVVLLAIGALAYFGVLSPQTILPERTVFPAPLPNLDTAQLRADGGEIEIAFKNNKGVKINIADGSSNAGVDPETGSDCTLGNFTSDKSEISNGENFILTWDCDENMTAGDQFKGTLKFNYVNNQTGQTITHSGSVDGSWN
ncbi:hypothetical protein K9L97_02785 [Candidatus Woesearchaeota archaeon]|nr:hypothetical protein [Candidatus Woesearchaeota archaeon]